MPRRRSVAKKQRGAAGAVLDSSEASLLDIVDNVLNKGVVLSGDLYHSTMARERRGVPPFNTDRAQTLASMDRFEQVAKETGAKVIIQHEPADIGKLPAFPQAAE